MAAFRNLMQWMLPLPTGHRAGPYPCCSVRTSSLEQSRVVNQTEYWLKYWYNDTSDGEEDDQEILGGLWKPPEFDEDEDMDFMITPGTVSALSAANSNNKSMSAPPAEKHSVDSNGANGETTLGISGGNFGLARAMRFSIAPLVTPTISEKLPVVEPEPKPEPVPQLSYFDKINNMIRSQLEFSYGHPPLKRENSEDADVEDNSIEGSVEVEDGDGMPKSEKIRECGRFDFKDGFKYSGEVDGEEMMAHGHGVLIGPSGTYAGLWSQGMQTVGVYTWYVGAKYEGTWERGKRHGYGVERRARWVYEGEWKDDKKTGYGVLRSHRGATFEGTWLESTQDGYGVETYADGGFYIGQWYRGMRQGYGVRVVNPKITPRDMLNIISTLAHAQHGLGVQDKKSVWNIANFPLQNSSDEAGVPQIKVSVDHEYDLDDRFESEKPEKQRIQNNGTQHPPPMEVYRGEWKNDKRSGYGVLETCTGMKYEGEWLNNFRSGYGVLKHKDGRQESGKWKQNRRQFVKKHCWSSTVKSFSVEVQRAMQAATHAGKEAERKSLTALQRIEGARREGESARLALEQARQHCKLAKQKAKSAAQKPLRRKGVRRGFRFCSDDSNSNDSDSRSRIPSNSSVSADESPEDVPEVKPKKTHPDNLSRITEQNSFDHSDYHSGPEDGDQENNIPHIVPEVEHRTEAASIKLPAIDESSECGSNRSYSSFVYRNVEKSICGAAKTPVLISPLARNIVQLREVRMSRSGAGTPCRPGSTTSSVASSCPSRPLHSKSHHALLMSSNETAQLERMDSVEI